MNETPEMIRKQMEQTKLQLALKLESLEQQVSTTVHSTETAVNATMGAVETVSGAVHNAVDSVANLLDVPRNVEKHPWLFVGGAVVVGYLAAEFLTAPTRERVSASDAASNPTTNQSNGSTVAVHPVHTASYAVGYQSGAASSPWHQLKDAVIGSLIGVVPQTLSRIIPLVVDKMVDNLSQPLKDSSTTTSEADIPAEPSPIESHRLHITSSGIKLSRNF